MLIAQYLIVNIGEAFQELRIDRLIDFWNTIGRRNVADWKEIFSMNKRDHKDILDAFRKWTSLRGGKTRNVDIIWFPKPNTSLMDMREKLKVAYRQQQKKRDEEGDGYFVENEVAIELAKVGAFTRPGTSPEKAIEQYNKETTANIPQISSFRMSNRLFRFLGWTTRRIGQANQYIVTNLGVQMTKFEGAFPSFIGSLSERDLVIRSLMNFRVFSVNDNIEQWDTRFKQRIVVNLLRAAEKYGYISNNELIVTAFALKDETDNQQVKEMLERLRRLHDDEITMIEAFKEVNIDAYDASAVNNAYDGPKVLLSLCRQIDLLQHVSTKATPFGNLSHFYMKMHEGKSHVKCPIVVNIITEFGKNILKQELQKTVIWFNELA